MDDKEKLEVVLLMIEREIESISKKLESEKDISKKVKETLAKLLSEWLFKDFGVLLEEPTPKDIEEA